jgi:hypothetical protein
MLILPSKLLKLFKNTYSSISCISHFHFFQINDYPHSSASNNMTNFNCYLLCSFLSNTLNSDNLRKKNKLSFLHIKSKAIVKVPLKFQEDNTQ